MDNHNNYLSNIVENNNIEESKDNDTNKIIPIHIGFFNKMSINNNALELYNIKFNNMIIVGFLMKIINTDYNKKVIIWDQTGMYEFPLSTIPSDKEYLEEHLTQNKFCFKQVVRISCYSRCDKGLFRIYCSNIQLVDMNEFIFHKLEVVYSWFINDNSDIMLNYVKNSNSKNSLMNKNINCNNNTNKSNVINEINLDKSENNTIILSYIKKFKEENFNCKCNKNIIKNYFSKKLTVDEIEKCLNNLIENYYITYDETIDEYCII